MYLEKLEIQGFKSFATKNVLVFPGITDLDKRGLTCIVGPNGSGKSNVADAVRWVLGEQSMKALRGKRSEDVIFSGSDKKGKLGMAEVSLFLNNEDRTAPVDYSEVVITRRLYRNGESEYILNNSRVRLADIQMLLAKSKFGQRTYSVIGQGMVEGFLNTSLQERKEFFDEATGVKQYQIKRDDSLNKLCLSHENLTKTQMLLAEIEPRLKSLTRQVGRLRKRSELEKSLKELQLDYYGFVWHEISDKFVEYNNKYLELEKTRNSKNKKLENANHEMDKLKINGGKNNNFEKLQIELAGEQKKKDELNKKLSKLEAQVELKLESQGNFDLSFLINKKEELAKSIETIKKEITNLKNIAENGAKTEKILKSEMEDISRRIAKLNSELAEAPSEESKKIGNRLSGILKKLERLDESSDMEEVKKIIYEAKKEIEKIIKEEDDDEEEKKVGQKGAWREIQLAIQSLAQKKEEATTKINENFLAQSACAERIRLLEERESDLQKEFKSVAEKISQSSKKINFSEIEKEQNELKKEITTVDKNIEEVREKINNISFREEDERNNLFKLQKELQDLQGEANLLNSQLGEIKVNSARYETKLEDLEIEIRQELGALKEIQEQKIDADINQEDLREKIKQAKRQLELIGGIDPAAENEYRETKERYDFLSGQVDDLLATTKSLEKIIKELDLIIKKQFDEEFKIIAKKFEEYFRILFSGGNAKIVKVMDKVEEDEDSSENLEMENSKESKENDEQKAQGETNNGNKKIKFLQKHNATGLAGIEIHATPPGKKIASIAMLSGGERALTAIALICAIIGANPSPFVILDEVDAALDEANSERLVRILDELSHKTQFIVVTHNRASMRRANILYGVTMGDDGMSRLISVKLEDKK
ncbi:MAG: AAA family ATPase [bacterium]